MFIIYTIMCCSYNWLATFLYFILIYNERFTIYHTKAWYTLFVYLSRICCFFVLHLNIYNSYFQQLDAISV